MNDTWLPEHDGVTYLCSKFWVLKETYHLFIFMEPIVFLQVALAEKLKQAPMEQSI